MRGMYPRWDEKQAIELCARWGVRLAQKISAMSIGERQRLDIVRDVDVAVAVVAINRGCAARIARYGQKNLARPQ